MNKRLKRINKSCAYYPCHEGLKDCTFCFCPLYPCLDWARGRYVFSKKQNKKVWSCRECSWIHQPEVVDGMFEAIRGVRSKGQRVKSIEQRAKSKEQIKHAREGVVILSHGSKKEKANSRVRDIIEKVKERTKLKYIEPAHLQLSGPSLQKSIKKLANKACKKIIVIPFFLLSGNHVKRDIPKLLEEEALRYPNIQFIYTEDLGGDERISEIVAGRIQNACTY